MIKLIGPGCQRSTQEFHPDWQKYSWTDNDLGTFIKEEYDWFLPTFDSYPEPIMRVDAARYFLLYHYGGVYADLGFETLKPLDALLVGKDLVVGQEPAAHKKQHFPVTVPFTLFDVIELDAVGGTMLLIKADLHRKGVHFPSHPYKHLIETEGLAAMAQDMGYTCWGLPKVVIHHSDLS